MWRHCKMSDRYNTNGNSEGEFQAESNELVLVNKLGIANVEEMEGVEFDALVQFQIDLFDELTIDETITAQKLCDWHTRWLGNIYEWAGDYRSVNMSKGDFIFAAAHLIAKLMADYEQDFLSLYTPCNNKSRDDLVEAMAICHIEFIIVHPFREGNGRLGRLLCTVMALQADMPVLDFELLEQDKERYILAIHAGHAGDVEPMKAIFSEVLTHSLQQSDLS